MLKTERDKEICARYSARDETGHVHCSECPLALKQVWRWGVCKANHHYDENLKWWVPDEVR